jgi:hypothetical protein
MLKKLLVAAAAVLISAPALADRGHGNSRSHWKHNYHARPGVGVPAPRVYYAPPPRVYYAPAPRVYYAPPAPVYYAPPPRVYPAPVPQSSISIRLHFPL